MHVDLYVVCAWQKDDEPSSINTSFFDYSGPRFSMKSIKKKTTLGFVGILHFITLDSVQKTENIYPKIVIESGISFRRIDATLNFRRLSPHGSAYDNPFFPT